MSIDDIVALEFPPGALPNNAHVTLDVLLTPRAMTVLFTAFLRKQEERPGRHARRGLEDQDLSHPAKLALSNGALGAWEKLTLCEGGDSLGVSAPRVPPRLIPLDPVNGKVVVNVTSSSGRYNLFVGGEKER